MFRCPICNKPLTDDKLYKGYCGVWSCCGKIWTVPSYPLTPSFPVEK